MLGRSYTLNRARQAKYLKRNKVMAKTNLRLMRKVRHKRVRARVIGTTSRPRLCIFRSLNHIYAQVIDDSASHTLVSVSTLDIEARDKAKQMVKIKQAELVGTLTAQRALDKGISQVVFDRGGFKYHGRIKVLAEAARQAGLLF